MCVLATMTAIAEAWRQLDHEFALLNADPRVQRDAARIAQSVRSCTGTWDCGWKRGRTRGRMRCLRCTGEGASAVQEKDYGEVAAKSVEASE
jgi:hypothetical protein